ncbi:MAG: GNAT family N-acetyltransferase [Bifidobacterium choerinum]
MGLLERFTNLLHRPAQRDETHGAVRIVVASDDAHARMIWDMLTEQIEHGWDKRIPYAGANPDDLYRPTLIGAWSQDRLIGGAFVMPDTQDAESFLLRHVHDGAQSIERRCCMIQGIATVPEHRGEGIGGRIKRFCDAWAANHGAYIVLSIPTTQQAVRLNENAGYHVLPPQVALVLQFQYTDHARMLVMPMDGTVPDSRWAVHVVREGADPAILIGQLAPRQTPGGSDYQASDIIWMDRTI